MIPSEVRAIFFDAVGTLLHPDPPAPLVYAAVGQRHGSRLTSSIIMDRFRVAFQRQEAYDLRQGLRTSEAREVERWRQIVAEVHDDVTDPDACFRDLFRHFSLPEAWRLEAEAASVLTRLAERGYQLGLASNFDARLRSVVAGWPDLRPIRHLVISSEVGWRKPAPGFFAALCARVDLTPGEVLLVGDDCQNDYEGARQAGLHALLLDPIAEATAAEGGCIRRLSDLLQDP